MQQVVGQVEQLRMKLLERTAGFSVCAVCRHKVRESRELKRLAAPSERKRT